MSAPIYQRVRENPKFQELVKRRTRFATMLSLIVLVAYYTFMMVVAFAPDVLRQPMAAGSTLTIGVPVGAMIIIVSWLLTGWYVQRANGEFDRINDELVREATR
jgi:uncharacterized membrane protein (DUF485 family)